MSELTEASVRAQAEDTVLDRIAAGLAMAGGCLSLGLAAMVVASITNKKLDSMCRKKKFFLCIQNPLREIHRPAPAQPPANVGRQGRFCYGVWYCAASLATTL